MSSDLLNEFGKLEDYQWSSPGGLNARVNIPQEDDFGDFEEPDDEVEQPIETLDEGHLLQRESSPEHAKHGQESPLHNFDNNDWGDFEHGTTLFDVDEHMAPDKLRTPKKVPKAIRKDELPSAPPNDLDDDFDDEFDPWEPQDASTQPGIQGALIPQTPASTDAQTPITQSHTVSIANIEAPPINIPPPSILLSWCATILKVSTSLKSDTNQQNMDYFPGHLRSLRAIARITAGRKLRWRRDTILSQNMKIGQAGNQGGMKLVSIDKSESRREDQEAAELIRLWIEQVGSLRATMATLSGHGSKIRLTLPDIAEKVPVRTAKPGEGAVSAPKPCFLCGIRREERVHRVDVEVEDSFGEWWVEHWGHVDCVELWEKQKSLLAKR